MTMLKVIHEGTKVRNNFYETRYNQNDFTIMPSVPANTVGVVSKVGIVTSLNGIVIGIVLRVDFEGYGPCFFNGDRISELSIVDNHQEGEIW